MATQRASTAARLFSSSQASVFPRTAYPYEVGTVDVSSGADTVVHFVSESQLAEQSLPALLKADFKASPGAVAVNYSGNQRIIAVGLGPEEKVDESGLRAATAACIHQLRSMGVENAAIEAPDLTTVGLTASRTVELVAQTAMLANYRFDKYLTQPATVAKNQPLQSISVVCPSNAEMEAALTTAKASVGATWLARDLANERGDVMNPDGMEAVCQDMAARHGMRIKVLNADQLQELGHNLHYAVGKGGTVPPRLVVLEYHGAEGSAHAADFPPAQGFDTALVGKGITFDTGGLNLKPTGFIEDMHMDMGGAAAVLGAMEGAAQAKLPLNIICAVALAENAIGADAMKPNAVIHSLDGKSVEVGNTDAEGRLVLCDTLTYIQRGGSASSDTPSKVAPTTVINVATLTGACVVALGEYAAGLFSNNDDLSLELQRVGGVCGERVWRLPILPEHTAELVGDGKTHQVIHIDTQTDQY
jgi:leucyl aminopeptidase